MSTGWGKVNVYKYESIAIVSKSKIDGTKFINCDLKSFEGLTDKRVFQGFTQLNSDVNELFFAKNVVLLEGPEDKIALTETLRKLGKIQNRIEEIEVTLIVAGGKQSIPFFTRVLNAFKINYVILHDLDIREGMDATKKVMEEKKNKAISDLANSRIINFPIKLEDTVGVEVKHFSDQYDALMFFADHSRINKALEDIVSQLLNKLGIK